MQRRDPILALGVSPSLTRLLRYFALRPGAKPGLRELQRQLGIGSLSSQRDLARLAALGVIRRTGTGRSVRYELIESSPLWGALLQLVARGTTPEAMLGEALRDVEGVEAAFIFGSIAAGTARPDSDVDLFVVGDALDSRRFHRAVNEAGMLLGREVNPVKYTKTELAQRLAGGARFLRETLSGPKEWVAGTPEAIAPIAIAAGVPFHGTLPA